MLKKCQVVMLSTNEKVYKGNNLFLVGGKTLRFQQILEDAEQKEFSSSFKHWKPQHLYILSDEKPKEGDWCYDDDFIGKVEDYNNDQDSFDCWIGDSINGYATYYDGLKKIIATTDKSLKTSVFSHYSQDLTKVAVYKDIYLPQPSESFIQVFIEEYNKGNMIKEVMVEYSNTCSVEFCASTSPLSIQCIKPFCCSHDNFKLKVNPKDNTITIRKVKDSWNREEVSKLIFMAYNLRTEDKHVRSTDSLNEWIDQNL